ncbi:MAG: FAD:protein FMN transferase [Pseudomonadota bacterium]|nr:FAD:protein FMN transferase [Pseudomonadota bacterium]
MGVTCRWPVWGLVLALVLAGCGRSSDPVEAEIYAMGTLVQITIYGMAPDHAAGVIDRSEAWLQRFGRDAWAFGDGELARLNAALARGTCAVVSDDLAQLIERARKLRMASAGDFDPAVGALVALWGFDRAPRDPARPFPEAPTIAALLPLPSMDAVHVSADGTVCGPRGLAIDLGGIGKGYAVDRLIDELARQGVATALVNAGGNLKTLGQLPQRGWRIGIRDPYRNGVMGTLSLDAGEAVSTSGDYERMFEYAGRRYHHLLDPRTGYPVRGLHAVTVVDPDAARADSASTALFVAGPDGWRQVAARMGITRVLVVREDGTVEMTSAMAERVSLAPGWAVAPIAGE